MQQAEPIKRNKQLSNQQIQQLKKLPQYLHLSAQQFILYNLVDKQSNSGLFKNERLLILNIKQEYLCYLSKIPPSVIPFSSEDQVNHQQFKQKLYSHQIYENGENKCTCRSLPDKNGIEIKLGKVDKKIQWIYYFSSKELMEEWFGHLHFIFTRSRKEIDQKYHTPTPPPPLPQQPKQKPSPSKQSENNIQTQQVNKNTLNISQNNDLSRSKKIESGQIQEIKPVHDDKESQFNQFSESAPLGKFIREDRKYNTEGIGSRKNTGVIYNTSPKNQTSIKKSESIKSKESNLPHLQNNFQSKEQQFPATSNLLKKQQKPKKPPQPSIDWNLLYYQGRDHQSKVYFDFLNQCIKYTTQLVDKLPLTKQIDDFDQIGSYFHTKNNGIAYKIAFGKEQTSLIYQLGEKNQANTDNYEIYDDLKEEFFEQRKIFFRNKEEKPSISCFVNYKGLSFLCRASNADEPSQKSNHSTFKRSNVNEDSLLKKMQNLQLFILSSSDLHEIMRYLNASTLNWSYLYHQTTIKIFKIYFLNEMYSQIFVGILNSQLAHIYRHYIFDELQETNSQIVDEVVNDSILMLVNRLFGKGKESDQLWEIIFIEVEKRYKIETTKESILSGYLLYSVIYKLGMKVKEGVNMKNTFVLFRKNKAIERENIEGFKPRVSCLNYELMSPLFQQIKENLQSSVQNNQELEMLISNEQFGHIPECVNYLTPKIHIQLSKTQPYSSSTLSSDIYECLFSDSPIQNNYEVVLSAISWLLQKQKQQEAFDLAFIKIEELIFWAGRTPIISLFYQSFAEYYLVHQESQKAIEQLKLSIKNLAEIFGINSNKLLRKKEELSQHLLSLNRRQESLRELNECKNICESNKYQASPTYSHILIKIAKLNLSMSKYNESITHSMVCLKQLQSRVEKQQLFESQESACEFLSVGELLLRAFELTNKRQELFEIISLCAERCQNIDSLKAYKRLFKIILFPHIKRLNLKQSQIYLAIVQQLNAAYKQSSLREEQLYKYIRQRRIQEDINRKLKQQFKNITKFYDEILKKKLLEEFIYNEDEYFKQRNDRNEVESFIRQTFLVTNFIGIGFVQAILKDVYYD